MHLLLLLFLRMIDIVCDVVKIQRKKLRTAKLIQNLKKLYAEFLLALQHELLSFLHKCKQNIKQEGAPILNPPDEQDDFDIDFSCTEEKRQLKKVLIKF